MKKKIAIIVATILCITILLACIIALKKYNNTSTNIKPTFKELIKDVDFDRDDDGYYDYDEDDISTEKIKSDNPYYPITYVGDEPLTEDLEDVEVSFVNCIINIMFDYDCTEEQMADAINSVNGKIVGGDLEDRDFYIKIKKSTYSELNEICNKLSEIDGVEAFIDEVYDERIFNDT